MAVPKGFLTVPVAFRSDGTLRTLELDDSDYLKVAVQTSGLPSGAATAANQATMITALQLIDDLRNALNDVGTDELRTIPYNHGIWGVSGVTQVFDNGQQINGIGAFYSVPSGKTFYMTSLYIQTVNRAEQNATGRVMIRDDENTAVITWRVDSYNYLTYTAALTFNPPLMLPEDYDVTIDSDQANYVVNATITGYTVDD